MGLLCLYSIPDGNPWLAETTGKLAGKCFDIVQPKMSRYHKYGKMQILYDAFLTDDNYGFITCIG